MVHAVGFGIRYRTPIGPVRVDLGFSINPPSFFGFKGTQQDLVNAGLSRAPPPAARPPVRPPERRPLPVLLLDRTNILRPRKHTNRHGWTFA